MLGESVYTAAGVYSLPVALPQGEVRLDFARPAGGAVLTVWAVPLAGMHNTYAAVSVVLVWLLTMTVVRLWPQRRSPHRIAPRYLVAYGALLFLLAALMGVLGLVIALAVVVVAEMRRRSRTQPNKSPAAH